VRFLHDRKLMMMLAVLIWFELSIASYFSVYSIRPDFFLIFLVFYAFRINWKPIVPIAFVLGVSKDIFSNSFFGVETASLALGAVFLEFLAVRFDREKRWIQLSTLFSFSLLSAILFFVISALIKPPSILGSWFLTKSLLSSCYTTLAGSAVLPMAERWLRFPLRGGRQYELF